VQTMIDVVDAECAERKCAMIGQTRSSLGHRSVIMRSLGSSLGHNVIDHDGHHAVMTVMTRSL